MPNQTLREVSAPYLVNPADEALGRETIIVRRNGEPVAAVVPYAEYQHLLALQLAPTPAPADPEFARNRAAFQRLLPELQREHRGEWVAIVNERVAAFGPSSSAVLEEVCERLGDVRMYVQEIRETPRVYRINGPRVVRSVSPDSRP